MVQRAIFLGSKKFGFNIFKTLYSTNPAVSWCVLCPPDADDNRSYYDEFQKYCGFNNIDLITTSSSKVIIDQSKQHNADVMIVCGYYKLLSEEVLNSFQLGVWGIHNSLLPKYRGGSPLVWQIINNEDVIGSSLFKLTPGMDDGPVLEQIKINNACGLTINEAQEKLEAKWIKKLPKLWREFVHNSIHAHNQDHTLATYCAQRNEADGQINWSLNAKAIDAFIRAQGFPYPRAFFKIDKKIVRIIKHKLEPEIVYGTPGQIFRIGEDFITVCCQGNTAIRLYLVEIEGVQVNAKKVINSIKIRLA